MRKSDINVLSMKQIEPIVLDILRSYDPQIAKSHEAENNRLLPGTTFWTVVQSVDNYLVGKYNPKAYEILKDFEGQRGNHNSLPSHPSETEAFNKDFFKFTLSIRSAVLPGEDRKEILKKLKISNSQLSKTLSPWEALESFVLNYLIHLQRFELDLAVSQGYGYKEDTEPQLQFSTKALEIYLNHRPELAKLLH